MDRWATDLNTDLNGLRNKLDTTAKKTTDIGTNLGTLPDNPTGVSASESGYIIDGVLYSEVTCTYTAPSPLGSFTGIFLVVANYRGSASLVKIAEDTYPGVGGGSHSFKVTLQRTNETVTLYFVGKNSLEQTAQSDWALSPSTTVLLDGNASAPNAPTGLAGTATVAGVSLTWNQNVESNRQSYTVYRNTTNSFGGSTKIDSVATTNATTVTYLDASVQDGGNYWYFITCVNTAFQESAASTSANVLAAQGLDLGVGKNILVNPGFESNTGGYSIGAFLTSPVFGQGFIDGWYVAKNLGSNFLFQLENSGFAPHTGRNNALVRLNTSQSIANATSTAGDFQTTYIPVRPGDVLYYEGYIRWDANAGLPAGVSGTVRLFYRLYDINKAEIGSGVSAGLSVGGGGWAHDSLTVTVPTTSGGSNVSFIAFGGQGLVTNASGSTFNTGGILYMDARFDDLSLTFQVNLDTEVQDGTSFVRTTPNEKTGAGYGFNTLTPSFHVKPVPFAASTAGYQVGHAFTGNVGVGSSNVTLFSFSFRLANDQTAYQLSLSILTTGGVVPDGDITTWVSVTDGITTATGSVVTLAAGSGTAITGTSVATIPGALQSKDVTISILASNASTNTAKNINALQTGYEITNASYIN